MKYNKQYFIDKFTAIPNDEWAIGKCIDDEGRKCALGHCGIRTLDKSYLDNEEAFNLVKLLTPIYPKDISLIADVQVVYDVNDGNLYGDREETTPKQRILEALNSLPD